MFGRAERGAFLKARQIAELLLGDPGLSADGRMQVDSKRTTDERSGLEQRQFFQGFRNRTRASGDCVHPGRRQQRRSVVRGQRLRLRNQSQALLELAIEQPRNPAWLGALDPASAHSDPISRRMTSAMLAL